jgi:hypothetical protein
MGEAPEGGPPPAVISIDCRADVRVPVTDARFCGDTSAAGKR